ncbi:MAG: DUF2397 family protein [Acidimicrobiales bacterium]
MVSPIFAEEGTRGATLPRPAPRPGPGQRETVELGPTAGPDDRGTISPMVDEPSLVANEGDPRTVVAYLVATYAEDYVAIMDVLESSVTDLSPAALTRALTANDHPLEAAVVEDRLEMLRRWHAVHATTDSSRIRRHADLLARNWRYTATLAGRQVQRFYRTVLLPTPVVREIPLAGLNRVVRSLEALRDGTAPDVAEAVGVIFVSHDDLDAALIGAEDTLATLADRYDLNQTDAAELRSLLVDYATRVAMVLSDGSELAWAVLGQLRERFADLAEAAVTASEARGLIERGALQASRGGRLGDWEGLASWFDPSNGRAARFAMRLIQALPGMHANLRRLHTSAGAATSRARALALAAACADPDLGGAIALAALGDHPWRKLSGAADDEAMARSPAWSAGPAVAIPELVRLSGRRGAPGRAPAAPDDTAARAEVEARRERRREEHACAVAEVLGAAPGAMLSEKAGHAALAALLVAVRGTDVSGRRTGARDGVACTLLRANSRHPAVRTASWRVWAPGRAVFFHRPGELVLAAGAWAASVVGPDEQDGEDAAAAATAEVVELVAMVEGVA